MTDSFTLQQTKMADNRNKFASEINARATK